MRIAVLGGGISGLATAFRHRAQVFESRDRVGGNIRTEEVEGCLVEWGPGGFLDNEPATLQLIRELGLQPLPARACAATRYIWRAGRLRQLPATPLRFLTSDCVSPLARLRALLEPFARKAPDGDESVYDFARRRLGRGVADVLVDAFVTGIFAGDPSRLSVQSALPKLKRLETAHGSLIRGAKGGGFGPRGVLTSFRGGLQELVDALAQRVDVTLASPWAKLEPRTYDRVVCTAPAPKAAPLLDGELKELVGQIPTAPLAVVATIFDDPLDVPDAFGFLVPRGQELRILGTLYDSSTFENRAPHGLRLFRTLVGGRRDPAALDLDDSQLLEIVARDLRRAWGVWKEPRATKIIRWPLGIAQYELGHRARMARIEACCPEWLRLAGSSYRGVSLNLCVKEALEWQP